MHSIADGGSYTVRIRNGPEVDNACAPNVNGDDLSVNVVLTLKCAASPPPTETPTDPPTRVEATVIKGTWNDDYRLDGKGLVFWDGLFAVIMFRFRTLYSKEHATDITVRLLEPIIWPQRRMIII